MRDYVRHGELDPAVAVRWAKRYSQQPFMDPGFESQIGANALARAYWPLTLATLWVAHRGDEARTAQAWSEFQIAWGRGLWNAQPSPNQVMSLDEAEQALWSTLEHGHVQSHSDVGGVPKSIDRLAWKRLVWVNSGPAQVVGYNNVTAEFAGVEVDAAGVKRHPWWGPSRVREPKLAIDPLQVVVIDAREYHTVVDGRQWHQSDYSDRRSFTFQQNSLISAPTERPRSQSPALPKVTYDEIVAWWPELEREHPEFEINKPSKPMLEGFARAKFGDRPLSFTARDGPWLTALKQCQYRLGVGERSRGSKRPKS